MIIKKLFKGSIQARASLWYTICNILQKGIQFIVIPIYTRLLTVDEYGIYSVFQSWKDILIIFATLNLYCGIFTKAMVDYENDRDSFTSSMQGLGTLITIFLFIIYILKHSLWNSIFSMNTITVILMFLYFIVYPAFSFWSVRQRVEYKYKKMVVVTIIISLIIPIVSLLLLYNTNLREKSIIYGYLLSQIGIGLYFYIFNFYKCKRFYNKKYWMHALKFNIPLIPHYLSLIVLGQADKIMIKEICGADKAGIYNLAYQVSMAINIIISAINNAMVPWTFERLKSNNYSEVKDKHRYLCIFVMVLNLIIILIAPEVIKILGTKEYLSAIWIIPLVAVSAYYTYCYGLFSNIEFYYGATKYVMVASIIGAALNIALNAIFIPIYGFIAAGYTTLFCYLLFLIMHYIFMKKIIKNRCINENIYDYKLIFYSCIIVSVIAGGCMLIYNLPIVRYTIIIILLIIIYINKGKIIELLNLDKKRSL